MRKLLVVMAAALCLLAFAFSGPVSAQTTAVTTPTQATPVGGVRTGDGGTQDGANSMAVLAVGGALVLAGGAYVALRKNESAS